MKKAQLEGMEQIMVIFVVIIIALVFFAIFLRVSAGKTREVNLEKLESSAVDIATIVSAMPELQCTKNNVLTTNCINLLRAEILSIDSDNDGIPYFIKENMAYYYSIFGFSKISIISTTDQSFLPIKIYENKGNLNLKKTFTITLPRLLYDPRITGNCFALGQGSCDFGYIKIEMYSG